MKIKINLNDTIDLMNSPDYRDRFVAEYIQTKIRYEKLKAFNTKIEAAGRTDYKSEGRVPMPKHDCPADLLIQQQRVMGEYLHILEVRALIEDIDLEDAMLYIEHRGEKCQAACSCTPTK